MNLIQLLFKLLEEGASQGAPKEQVPSALPGASRAQAPSNFENNGATSQALIISIVLSC